MSNLRADNKKTSKILKISLGNIMLIVFLVFLFNVMINYFSRTNITLINSNETKAKSSATIYGQTVEGVHKSGNLSNFANGMPLGTIFIDSEKLDSRNTGIDGFELETYGNTNIKKQVMPRYGCRVIYTGPNNGGIERKTRGYVTDTSIERYAAEEDRSKFSMKFNDAAIALDNSKKDILVTISNIYIVNQRTDTINFFIGWTGRVLAVQGVDTEYNDLERQDGNGVGMKCDVSISVLNKDGTPLTGEKLLFEVNDLDVPDKLRQGDFTKASKPRLADDRYTETEEFTAYDNDFREGIYILKGSLSDAYMPSTNWIEARRLSEGENANGIRFAAYSTDEDTGTLNTGILTLVDSEEFKFRWYGSTGNSLMGTQIFTSSSNHHITATSSIGGNIYNYINPETIIANSDNYPERSYLNNFADGSDITYIMNAKDNYDLENIKIDDVTFLPNDFSSVAKGENDKEITVRKNTTDYKFNVTKDSYGRITKVVYIFNDNNANHEIIVNWKTIPASLIIKYKEKGSERELATSVTKDGVVGEEYNTESDIKTIDNYTLVEDSGNTTGSYTMESATTPIEVTYYYKKRNDLSYKVYYKEEGTERELAPAKEEVNQTFGTIVKEEAKDIDGYTKVEPTSASIEITAGTNEHTFYYKKRNDLSYKVYYKEEGTERELAEAKEEKNKTFGTTVTENAIDIAGYTKVAPTSANIVITTGTNEHTFYYKKRNDLSYKVYYKEEGTERELAEAKEGKNQTFGTTVKEEAIDIAGYGKVAPTSANIVITTGTNEHTFYYRMRTDLSYKVYYLEKGTNNEIKTAKEEENQELGTTITSADEVIEIDGYKYDSADKESITITAGTNEIKLYYTKRNDLGYKVYYKEEGTEEELATAKEGKNQKFGTTVTENAIDIAGYTKVAPTSANILITTGTNEHTFYYKKRNDLSYKVNYYEKGTTNKIATTKEKGNQTYKDLIKAEDEVIEIAKYNYDSCDKESITIDTDIEKNVINLYYTKKGTGLLIKYIDEYTGDEISGRTTKTGTIDEPYSTTPKEIEGYDYIRDTGNTSGNLTEEEIEIIYYYKAKAKVITKHIDKLTGDEIIEQETKDGHEGDVYTVKEKVYDKDDDSTLPFKDYELIQSEYPDNSTGTMKKELTTVVFYYIHNSAGVKVKHIDVKTNREIAIQQTIEGHEGDDYTTGEKEIEGYDLVTDRYPENATGKMKIEETIVNYYYIKKTKVIVKHIDKKTEDEIIDQEVINGHEGDNYETSGKEYKEQDVSTVPFKDYVLVEEPSNKSGLMTADPIELKYYYAHKSAGIEVNHIDVNTNKNIAEKETKTGKEGDSYTTHEKEIEGYDLVTDRYPENATGTMKKELITVNYYYVKKTKVTAKYIDQSSNREIADAEEIDGHEGESYTTETKDIEGYILIGVPANKSGRMTAKPIEVIYYYAQISAGVIEKHIDEFTNEVLDSKTYQGNEGDAYTTSSKTFEGYELDNTKLPTNAEGTMTKDPIEVKYYYRYKTKVTTKYVDKVTGQEIVPSIPINGYEGEDYRTEKKEYDEEKEETIPFKDYVLIEEPENKEGKMTKDPITVTYYYIHKSAGVKVNHLDVKTNQPVSEQEKIGGNEGDDYTTHEKDLENYDLVTDRYPNNAEGKMKIEEIVVNYYYIKKGKITVKYIDKITGKELTDDVIIEGHEGEDYETEEKKIVEYTLENTPNNAKGIMKKEDTEVIYYYKRKTEVIVKYVDKENGKEIEEKETIKGYELEEYKANKKDIKNYILIEEPKNKEGKMTKDPIDVIYYYRQAIFNLSIDKQIKEIQVNGETKKINKDIAKVEIHRKKIKDTEVKVVYTIKVTNDGEIEGNATIEENIPEGMIMLEEDNKEWNIKENKATITTNGIKPGESVEYTVVLTWDNSNENFGTKKNIVKIKDTKNVAGFEEKDTDDNTDDAQFIITVSTGAKTVARAAGITTIVLSAIGVCIVVIKRRTKE